MNEYTLSRARRLAAGLALVVAALGLPGSPGLAAPRVGQHDAYTRLVFDLPKTTTPKVSQSAGQLTVRVGSPLRAEQGAVTAPGVRAYRVSGDTVTLTLAPGYGGAKTAVWPASSGSGARLVIDVPTTRVSVAANTAPAPAARPAATPTVRAASTATPRTRPRVVLDAGHGGIDPGMVSRWVKEKDVTLDVALRTRAELVRHGVEVVMVRATDRHLSTNKRQDLDMRSDLASSGSVSAFVSIHVNAASASAQGIETYYFGAPLAGSARSVAVLENGGGSVGQELTRRAASAAQNMLGDILAQAKLTFSRQLAARVQSRLIASTGAVNRGVHTDAFYVIRNPATPAILVEVGFGSHPVEGPKLATAAYREQLAQALARAILDFLNTK